MNPALCLMPYYEIMTAGGRSPAKYAMISFSLMLGIIAAPMIKHY